MYEVNVNVVSTHLEDERRPNELIRPVLSEKRMNETSIVNAHLTNRFIDRATINRNSFGDCYSFKGTNDVKRVRLDSHPFIFVGSRNLPILAGVGFVGIFRGKVNRLIRGAITALIRCPE